MLHFNESFYNNRFESELESLWFGKGDNAIYLEGKNI